MKSYRCKKFPHSTDDFLILASSARVFIGSSYATPVRPIYLLGLDFCQKLEVHMNGLIWKSSSTRADGNIVAVRPRTLSYGHRTGHLSVRRYDWHLFYHSFARSAPISDRELSFLRSRVSLAELDFHCINIVQVEFCFQITPFK